MVFILTTVTTATTITKQDCIRKSNSCQYKKFCCNKSKGEATVSSDKKCLVNTILGVPLYQLGLW